MASSTATNSTSSQDAWRKPGRVFRARLLKQDEEEGGNHFVLSPTCSIRKYFDVADRVLDQFLQHPIDSKEDLVEAYLVGNRLCRFLSNVLPTHPDYWSSDPEIVSNRSKSHSQLVELMYFVKRLAVMIDEEEHQSYISRVLDSSAGTEASRHLPSVAPGPSKAPGYRKIAAGFETTLQEQPDIPLPVVAEEKNNSFDSVDDNETRDPSLELLNDSVTTEENFDDMWAKATSAETVDVRTRPMKDPSQDLSVIQPAQDESVDDGWHSFSEDMSWTKMSLSVSSSKFQSISEDPRRSPFEPPEVVKSKRKKKKSKQLDPIVDIEETPILETRLEKRIRRAQRRLRNLKAGVEVPYDSSEEGDDYPPPPETDYVGRRTSPPRDPPSPTNVLEEWPAGWDPNWDNNSVMDLSMDDTKVSLMTDGGKSTDADRSNQRLSRRERALKGLKCVKCLVIM